MLAVVRHGDRTPKQKVKVVVTHVSGGCTRGRAGTPVLTGICMCVQWLSMRVHASCICLVHGLAPHQGHGLELPACGYSPCRTSMWVFPLPRCKATNLTNRRATRPLVLADRTSTACFRSGLYTAARAAPGSTPPASSLPGPRQLALSRFCIPCAASRFPLPWSATVCQQTMDLRPPAASCPPLPSSPSRPAARLPRAVRAAGRPAQGPRSEPTGQAQERGAAAGG